MGLEEVLPISLQAPRLGLVLLLNVQGHACVRVRVRAIQLNRRLDPTAEGAREPRAVSPTLSPSDDAPNVSSLLRVLRLLALLLALKACHP